jgi:hypothetical protein
LGEPDIVLAPQLDVTLIDDDIADLSITCKDGYGATCDGAVWDGTAMACEESKGTCADADPAIAGATTKALCDAAATTAGTFTTAATFVSNGARTIDEDFIGSYDSSGPIPPTRTCTNPDATALGYCAQTVEVDCSDGVQDADTASCESDGAGGFRDACAELGRITEASCGAIDQDGGVTDDCAWTQEGWEQTEEVCMDSVGTCQSLNGGASLVDMGTCAQDTAVDCGDGVQDADSAGCESDGAGGFRDACAQLSRTDEATCVAVDQDGGGAADCAWAGATTRPGCTGSGEFFRSTATYVHGTPAAYSWFESLHRSGPHAEDGITGSEYGGTISCATSATAMGSCTQVAAIDCSTGVQDCDGVGWAGTETACEETAGTCAGADPDIAGTTTKALCDAAETTAGTFTTSATYTLTPVAGCESDGADGFRDACAQLGRTAEPACLAVDEDAGVADDCAWTEECRVGGAKSVAYTGQTATDGIGGGGRSHAAAKHGYSTDAHDPDCTSWAQYPQNSAAVRKSPRCWLPTAITWDAYDPYYDRYVAPTTDADRTPYDALSPRNVYSTIDVGVDISQHNRGFKGLGPAHTEPEDDYACTVHSRECRAFCTAASVNAFEANQEECEAAGGVYSLLDSAGDACVYGTFAIRLNSSPGTKHVRRQFFGESTMVIEEVRNRQLT